MEIGKISENVLKRSVIKQLHTTRDEVICGSGIGEDCAAVGIADDEMLVLSTDPITGTSTDIGKLAVLINMNDLASSGAILIGIMVTILLPENSTEEELKEIMSQMSEVCDQLHIQIMGGHTEVTDVVTRPVLSVTGVGKVKKGEFISTGGAKPGMDLILTKWIALEGTSMIAKEKSVELQQHFPAAMVETAMHFDQYLSVVPESLVASQYHVAAMHDVTEGGIFGALWEMAEASGVGLDIDLRAIPLRQETVEICEYYDLNPYQLISSGSMLIATTDGNGLLKQLHQENIPAALIGRANDSKDRILWNDGERRFLEPPKIDEFHKVL